LAQHQRRDRKQLPDLRRQLELDILNDLSKLAAEEPDDVMEVGGVPEFDMEDVVPFGGADRSQLVFVLFNNDVQSSKNQAPSKISFALDDS
jgi:hypothetical protein